MQSRRENDMNLFEGDKYFYLIRGSACLNKCRVLNDRTHIGSAHCRKCSSCLEHSVSENYIVCSQIDDALGKQSIAVVRRDKNINP